MTRSIIVPAVIGLMAITAAPTHAVVYCKTVGVPKGCVARAGVPLVAPPVDGGVGGAASGVGVRPGVGAGAEGVPGNRGGPVNRVGPR